MRGLFASFLTSDMLGSQKHLLGKLQSLSAEQFAILRDAFAKNAHPQFRRAFAANRNKPYGTAAAYAESIRNANLEGW